MGFDTKAFQRTQYQPREGVVALAALAPFFSDGEAPEFTVRGLTSVELAEAAEAAGRDKMLSEVVTKLAGGERDKVTALLKGVGVTDDIPGVLKKKLEHVRLGCITPALTLEDAVKLAECHPIEFNMISNEIMALTGQGQIADVKPRPSGQTPT